MTNEKKTKSNPSNAHRHVRDVMTTDLVQMQVGEPVSRAAQLMRECGVGGVMVMQDQELAGFVTDRDIVVRCVAQEGNPSSTPIEKVCSTDLATLSPDDEIENAVRLMAKKAIRRVPVLENGKPCGILSLGDLAVDRDDRSALAGISSANPNV